MGLPKPCLQAKLSNCFDQCFVGNEHKVWEGGEMNWQQVGAEHFDGLKDIRFDKRLQLFIWNNKYYNLCVCYVHVCTHTKYKDQVTFREVSRVLNDSY